MKKYLITLSAFTVLALAAAAQSKENPTGNDAQQPKAAIHAHGWHGSMHHHHNLMTKLQFTDAQKQQMKELNLDYRTRIKDLEKDDNITLKDYRAKKAGLEQERKAKFQAILTPDQKNTIAQAKTQRAEKMKMMSQKRLEKMKTDLNLTDEQVSKIQDARKSSMEKARAIRENPALTQEQKKEEFMSLMKSRKESMNNILTADQLKKKEEMRNTRIRDMKNKRTDKDS
jgi:Spy/CpxP family protein refolding chaperone